ncbi:MAG: VUT family protein, partial [Deltaproteobacteria bacterium]|nr:VUT family protein [Deltaproteobacteria bacterium]
MESINPAGPESAVNASGARSGFTARWVSAFLYLGGILLGNVFVLVFGIVVLSLTDAGDPARVYFSLTFPLGGVWIGLTFSFRDFVQRYWSGTQCWMWMLLAGAMTFFLDRQVAVASVAAFMAGEGLDWLVFHLLRRKSMQTRMVLSNLFSCPVDSLIFVTLAFGLPWYSEAVWGQALV